MNVLEYVREMFFKQYCPTRIWLSLYPSLELFSNAILRVNGDLLLAAVHALSSSQK